MIVTYRDQTNRLARINPDEPIEILSSEGDSPDQPECVKHTVYLSGLASREWRQFLVNEFQFQLLIS